MVLQQRIWSRPFERGGNDAEKWIGRSGDQEAEECAARKPGADGERHVLLMLVAVYPGRCRDVDAEDESQEENRPFEGRPETDDGDPQRHLRRSDVCNILHTEVVRD